MIKTMLSIKPKLNDQVILSYFTRPGRDLNHRLIGEIKNGRFPAIDSAPIGPTLFYMARCLDHSLIALDFTDEKEPPGLPMPIATLNVIWWPVGQGLFMSGRLSAKNLDQFNWVYDCGSSSGAKERDVAIKSYRERLKGPKIDLVVLSHFDEDHINGIIALIKDISVKTLLLPYLPPWRRLLIAIEEGLAEDNPLMNFYINPVDYLAGEGFQIEEIVFVPGARPGDIVPVPEGVPDPDPGADGDKPAYEAPQGSEDDPALVGARKSTVRILGPCERITVPALWEFVPYNDATMQPLASPTFINRASRVARFFLAKPERRKKALKILKQIYKKIFGEGVESANRISLFLYSGPIERAIAFEVMGASGPVGHNLKRHNLAQLATGDGYLDTLERLEAMRKFFSPTRINRIGLFQVMHHGAEANSYPGLADILKPVASIFSSDPGFTHGHPHAKVLRDFWPWNPIRVDKSNSFEIVALLLRFP